jgi:hypothetical protein
MNHFLIYLSDQMVQNTKGSNAALQALNKIGRVAIADFNLWVVETDDNGAAVCAAMTAAPQGGFFVATACDILAYRGDGPFAGALKLLKKEPIGSK